jgi:hypothetical protein
MNYGGVIAVAEEAAGFFQGKTELSSKKIHDYLAREDDFRFS